VALLPVSIPSVALCALAGGAAFWVVRRGVSAAPFILLTLIGVAWLPFDLPPAQLLWSGRLTLLLWLVLIACIAPAFVVGVRLPARPQLTAGVLAFAIGAVAFWQVKPQVPGGDEPHYLIITQSLLKDADLKIENNHRARHYEAYYAAELPPDFRVRGRDGQIYSIHAPGVSALVAPAFAVAGYRGAVFLLLVIAAVGSALMWRLAYRVTDDAAAAWFGWAGVTFSATWVFHSFTVYPDGVGAVLVLTGVWALLRADAEARTPDERVLPWLLHGAALAALPWLHTRFSVLAAGFGALVLLRLPAVSNPAVKAFAFLSIPAISCIAWLGSFIAIYGTANPAVPYGGEAGGLEYVPDGFAGLLFDQGFGLLAYAPVLTCAFVGVGIMIARLEWRRFGLELLFVVLPYILVVTHYPMWWGGRSAPARFFVPVLLWMALPAAVFWASVRSRTTRVSAAGALVVTIFACAVLVFAQDGRLAFNEREAPAVWLEWLNGSVDLPNALPMWFRAREAPLLGPIVIWISAGLLGWLVLRRIERAGRVRDLGAFSVATTAVFVGAATSAAAVSWMLADVTGRTATPAQFDLLRRLSTKDDVVAVDLDRWQRVNREALAAALHISPPTSAAPGGAGRNDRPMFALPGVPAGTYRLRPSVRAREGWIMVGIGRDQFAVVTRRLDEGETIDVHFPVDVRALLVRVDEDARRNIRSLSVEPLRILLPKERLTDDYARQAVRYGPATVYFLDRGSFPEPEAFWVGGAQTSQVVIAPDEPRATRTLHLRNGGAENILRISTGEWREEWHLAPGEERRVEIPVDHTRGATLFRFTTTTGFRPSEVNPNSRDTRYLGVWMKLE
jgi:hypothetical protein